MSGDSCPANSCNDRASFEPDGGELIGSYYTIRIFEVTAHNSPDPPPAPDRAHLGSRLPWAPPLSKVVGTRLSSKLLERQAPLDRDPLHERVLAGAAFRTAFANRYVQEARKVMAKTRGVKIGVTRSRQC